MKKIGLIVIGLVLLVSPLHAYTFEGIGNTQGAKIDVDFHPESDSVTCSFMGDMFTLSRPHSNPPIDLWMAINDGISMVMTYNKKTGILKINMVKIETRETQDMTFKFVNSNKYTTGF